GEIPDERRAQAEAAVAAGVDPRAEPPWVTDPVDEDPVALMLASTWGPSLSVTGLGGAPPPEEAGNVQRAHTEAALSLRLPPGVDATAAAAALERAVTADVPAGAQVTLTTLSAETGWAAPPTAPWLAAAVDEASTATFGAP